MFQRLLLIWVIFSLIIISNAGSITHSFNLINDPKTGLGLHPPKTPTTTNEQAEDFFNDTNSTYSNTDINNTTYSGSENLKKSRPKKNSWNQIIQFHGKEVFFCNFKNCQKSIYRTGKKFKIAKNAISQKSLFDFTSFLPGLF